MNSTYMRLQSTMSNITGPLNITRADFDSIFKEPFDFITDSFTPLVKVVKELSASVGSFLVFF